MNLIADRIAYFLKDIPPYQFLSFDLLTEISENIEVKFFAKESVIFLENNPNSGFCYVVKDGIVALNKYNSGNSQFIDFCERGDTFGVRSILTKHAYVMSAIATEDALIYAIPTSLFLRCLEQNQQFANYFAAGYASGQAVVRLHKPGTRFNSPEPPEGLFQYPKTVITCAENTTIREAAKLMSLNRVGSIVITNSSHFPRGIVTDKDLRNNVVAAGLATDCTVATIMSTPVRTAKPTIQLSEVQTEFIRLGIHHLVITENGTTESPVCGIVSSHDVLIASQQHPAALLKTLQKETDWNSIISLRNQAEKIILQLLTQGHDLHFISTFINHINDILIKKSIHEFLENNPNPHSFCWLALGSDGRNEQLLRTDIDHALIIDEHANQEYFLQLAQHVNKRLFSCGFQACPADVMASNPTWCLTLSQWKNQFSAWIQQAKPHQVMLSSIFFDLRAVAGFQQFADDLKEHIKIELKKHPIFLNYLAKNALQNPPPLGFFKHMVLEHDQQHADSFDIKKRALLPICDAARVLAFEFGFVESSNTRERLTHLKEIQPKLADVYSDAIQAYETFLFFRAKYGLTEGSDGRYMPIKTFTTLEKQQLKAAFKPISALQQVLEVRFQTAFFP